MDATAAPEQTQPKPPRTRINYALATQLIAAGKSRAEIAPQVGAKNANTLGVGLSKRGVTKAKIIKAVAGNMTHELTQNIAYRVVNQASEILKMDMHNIVQTQVSKLKGNPTDDKVKKVKNIGEALEPYSRIAKTVHGWGDGNELAQAHPGSFLDCGVIDTTGCVVPEPVVEQTPQLPDTPKPEPPTEQT